MQAHGRNVVALRAYFGLSRTPHAALDMATPALAALVWLGRFPSAITCAVGLVTVFAGYISVYALNDLVDCDADRKKACAGSSEAEGYLDAALVRHPIAQGLLSARRALAWILAWGAIAAAGAFFLNPVCGAVFLGACALEVVYCRLCSVTPCRALVSGVVKTLGALAAVLAVDPHPSAPHFLTLFLWLFFWEIGGQNIPADWADIAEDRQLGAQTIPVRLGERWAGRLVVVSLALSVLMKLLFVWIVPGPHRLTYAFVSAGMGTYLLLIPAFQLLQKRDKEHVVKMFNRASYYPAALLAAAILKTVA